MPFAAARSRPRRALLPGPARHLPEHPSGISDLSEMAAVLGALHARVAVGSRPDVRDIIRDVREEPSIPVGIRPD